MAIIVVVLIFLKNKYKINTAKTPPTIPLVATFPIALLIKTDESKMISISTSSSSFSNFSISFLTSFATLTVFESVCLERFSPMETSPLYLLIFVMSSVVNSTLATSINLITLPSFSKIGRFEISSIDSNSPTILRGILLSPLSITPDGKFKFSEIKMLFS